MRITIVTGPFYPVPPAPCGAVERLMRDLAEQFAKPGHDVTVLCRHWPGQAKDETIDGVRYVRRMQPQRTGNIKIDLAKDLRYSLGMLRRLPASDVVLTNVFWLPVLITRLRPGVGKVVVNVNRRPKGQMKLYRRAARIVAASTDIREQIVAQCPDVAPIVRMIPNPIDTAVFTPPPDDRPRDPNGRTIVYTGRVHPEKGLGLLIDAARALAPELPGLRVRIIGVTDVARGGGGDEHLAELRRRAEGLPVEFVPPIYDRPALAAALQAADVYCYPSLAEQGEAMPVAPLEAMATGLVPVVSDLPQFRDYVEPGVTGVVFNHRATHPAQELAAAVLQLLHDRTRMTTMSRSATQTAQRFANDAVARMYLDDFAALARA